ncbi:hypothetical protein V8C42DRAFT_357900 [Trichoderma barbatum]
MGKLQDVTRFLLAAGGSPSADGKSTHLFYEDKNSLYMETWTGSELADRTQVVASVRTGTCAPLAYLRYKRVFVVDENNTLKCFTETLRAEDEGEDEDEDDDEENGLWESEELDDLNIVVHSKSQLAVSCGGNAIIVFYQNLDGTLGAIEDDGEEWKAAQLPASKAFPGTPLASLQDKEAAYFVYVATDRTLRYMEHSNNEWKDAPFSGAFVDGATAKISVAKDEKAESDPKLLVFCLADNALCTIKRGSPVIDILGTVKDGVYKPTSDQECVGFYNWSMCPYADSSPFGSAVYDPFRPYDPFDPYNPMHTGFDRLHLNEGRSSPYFNPYYPPQPQPLAHKSYQPATYPQGPLPQPPPQPNDGRFEQFEETPLQRTARRPEPRAGARPFDHQHPYQPPRPLENPRHPQPPPQETSQETRRPPQQYQTRYSPQTPENSRQHQHLPQEYQHPPQEYQRQYQPLPQETLRQYPLPNPPPPQPKAESNDEYESTARQPPAAEQLRHPANYARTTRDFEEYPRYQPEYQPEPQPHHRTLLEHRPDHRHNPRHDPWADHRPDHRAPRSTVHVYHYVTSKRCGRCFRRYKRVIRPLHSIHSFEHIKRCRC